MQDVYRFDDFEVRRVERELRVGGERAGIGSRAFDVLLALLDHRDRVVSKNELLDLVWPGLVVEENNLQAQVSALRKFLGPKAIATIPGRGYRFALPLAVEPTISAPAAARSETAVTTALTNLPAADEMPFGRDADMAAVTQLLREHRLVSVVGAGGIGKTRLAQEVARRQIDAHASGVWWVDLAALSNADGIVPAIVNAARLQLEEGDPLAELAKALAHRSMLLVLDNCEHLAAAVARVVQVTLDAAPALRVLATSQEPLKTPGEYAYRLDALAVPPPGTSLEVARTFGAIQLLEQRAKAVDRLFSLDESTIAGAIELCRHLDGIALAIEMAAVRLPLLGLEALQARLTERLKLLRSASRLLPARHQTLRATLDWSHSLLDAGEQAVLRRLSVFGGSFSLDSALRVAAFDVLEEWTVLDALTALIEKSLVHVERSEPPRYRLLETTRLYAAEKLKEDAEPGVTLGRHSEAMAALADESNEAYWALGDKPWLARYAADYDDLQSAFDRACKTRRADVAASTGEALFNLDRMRGLVAPVRNRARSAHALLSSGDARTQARLWNCIARFLASTAELPLVLTAPERVAAWRRVGDKHQVYLALGTLSIAHVRAGDWVAAERALADAHALEDETFPRRLLAELAGDRIGLGNYRKDATAYRESLRETMRLAEEVGAEALVSVCRRSLADAALMAGDVAEAIALGRAAIADPRVRDRPRSLAVALSNLNAALLMAGEWEAARQAAVEVLPLAWQAGIVHYFFDHVALYAARTGHGAQAAQLLGFANRIYVAGKEPRQPNEARSAEQAEAAAMSILGADAYDRMRSAGEAMKDDQAQAIARAVLAEV
ncbi:MAG TPA: winged helix-turn-helix domain-containing protein [Casimicrobiaceae bacterium]|nr:winged helix-turn-helix domain-containing protein [Casimicrobiaceae bacterium]